MINISLTDFIDFVSKAGTTKFTKVKTIKNRGDYETYKDFWRPLRNGIVEYHERKLKLNHLDQILNNLTDKKKIKLYPELIKKYKSFLGRKKIEWFEPPFKEWKYNDLRVSLNPELGLDINDKLYAIKLYFKADKLTQPKANLILLLLNEKLKKKEYKDVVFAILDVPNKKLFENDKLDKTHIPLLEGEALSFINIWNSLD